MRAMFIGVLALGVAAIGCDDDEAKPGIGQNDGRDALDEVGAGEVDVVDGQVVCTTDDECVGAIGDLDGCEIAICHTSTGRCLVAEAPDLTPCDDGASCTTKSFCTSGTCEAFPSDTIDCDDGDPCTIDGCNAEGQCTRRFVTTGECAPVDLCGNGRCDLEEAGTCPEDCRSGPTQPGGGCGDGACDSATFESVWCPQDCSGGGGNPGGGCGDGACDTAVRVGGGAAQDWQGWRDGGG